MVQGLGTDGDGLGVYLGGYLDAYTVPRWSPQVPRVYLESMLIFDIVLFPSDLPNLRARDHLETIHPHRDHRQITSPLQHEQTAQ